MDRVEEILSTPPVAPLIGFAALLLLALWILNTAARPAPKQAGLRSWLRANYWLAMVLAGLSLGGLAAIFYLVEIGISVRALVDRLVTAASDPTTDAEDLRNLATATAVLLAALAAAATLVFQLVRVWVTERQTTTAEQNLITARINEAVAGLGAEKVVKTLTQGADGEARVVERSAPNIEVRVGAILSLERISISNPPDHVRIMEILCAYVRENACIVPIKENPSEPEDWKQRTDTQMALTVLGRRGPDKITLEQARGYALDLRGADVQLADMSGGAWQKARLSDALMARALLFNANLQGANLEDANLQGADLRGANLQGANLVYANLQGADLWAANLQGAYLEGAKLNSADLINWTIARTFLRSAEFAASQNLSQDSVNSAFGVASGIGQTVLPDGVTPPAHWHIAEDAQDDSGAHLEAAWDAYEDWLASLPEDTDDTSP
ncbi:pentapeptide repeat-containing protein [Dinoroseobacter sp. S375]|uniref:pentapeptide repeat-containing protein n=1 Tax=Dinoroseobacter sp. S375 TaxID=3415136 RepID=UPI003C7C3EBC